ncbi:hypothetical protein GALL_80310 [mine drainage metagenome]|uniref:Lipoprotein n=1 Tax=mine drainage metagenome TaxID=410659 RepID=A0A1J5SNT8_9ZZZZ
MKKATALILFLALAGCAHKHEPIYNPTDPMPAAAQTLSQDQLEHLIVEAGETRGWRFQHLGPGHLLASQTQPKMSAVVDITFDSKNWSIRYHGSEGLLAQGGTIHGHYNFWIRNLEHSIEARLDTAAVLVK